MNNAAFRSLISSSRSSQDGDNRSASSSGAFKRPQTATSLGSRSRSLVPMTPRNVPGFNPNRDLARQVAEQTSSTNSGQPPLKKFKASAAPKGTKLGKGYVDRAARLRQDSNALPGAADGDGESNGEDDKETRLRNLEEQFKLGQISQGTLDQSKQQIGIGGDVGSTHLVKGLDWRLLERVRRGEDVSKSENKDDKTSDSVDGGANVDEELERALEKEVVKSEEKSQLEDHEIEEQAPQLTLTRDEILRRFREQRTVPAPPIAPAAPVLNDKFKKMAAPEKPGKRKFVESVNGRRREVLIITNKDGTTKRKTRWIDPENSAGSEQQQPLGMEVPADMAAKHKAMLEAEAAEDDNEDIFKDAGDDYNPLAGIESDEDDDGSGGEQETKDDKANTKGVPPTTEPTAAVKRRNYFSTSKEEDGDDSQTASAVANDPTILAALKRAAQIRQREDGLEDRDGDGGEQMDNGSKSSAFLAKLKERERQDAADLDYGFGESRFGDEDDDEAGPLYGDEEGQAKSKSGRKRGPKKRKGDKDNVKDVMGVLEGRNNKTPG